MGANDAFWLTVDLPKAIEFREQFITPDAQHHHCALSVLDRKWFDLVPKNEPVFISAQGLFMYLPETEVIQIIHDISTVFPEGYIMFDTIPKWISKKTMSPKGWKKTKYYTTPKMPWGINRNKIWDIRKWSKAIQSIEEINYDFPRGIQKWGMRIIHYTPVLNRHLPTGVKIKF